MCFRTVIWRFPARYRLGVTATMNRKDGLEEVFFQHIGKISVKGELLGYKATVNLVDTKIQFTGKLNRFKPLFVQYETFLVNSEVRNNKIIKVILKAVEKKRKVLILSGRRTHLAMLYDKLVIELKKLNVPTDIMGFYAGGLDQTVLDVSARKQVIFGTYSMAAEGLDIPDIDTLILATPRGDIIQSVGRILRVVEDKKLPVIVDFVDTSIKLCKSMEMKRKVNYKKMGCIFST